MGAIREEHWRDIAEEGEDKKNIHALRWEVYVKEKLKLINRYFLVSVPHPKGVVIVWTCVKDHIINEKEDYKDRWFSSVKSAEDMAAEGVDYCGPVKTSHHFFRYVRKVDKILAMRFLSCYGDYSNISW